MLEAKVFRAGDNEVFNGLALNEILVSKGTVARMLNITLDCDGTRVAAYRADGLIVSTPTGSTAYSMSAGGPIVDPRLNSLVACPVCPHAFASARAILFSPEALLTVTASSSHGGDMYLTCDGKTSFRLHGGDRVVLSRSPFALRMIRLKDNKFYETLFNKFNAGKDIYSKLT